MKITSKIAPSFLTGVAMEAALKGAGIARSAQLGGLNPQQKSGDKDDLVTEGDEAAQRAILAILPRIVDWDNGKEPVGVLAEEKHALDTHGTRLRWVVDPIDGTLPYSRGEAFWCVSIALQEKRSDGWLSRIGVVYQASEEDKPEELCGKLFWADSAGAFVENLNELKQLKLAPPASAAPIAELGASGDFALWAKEKFGERKIATRFRRSICHATTELLLGNLCAVVQDAGPLEWDVAAILPIARLAGAHVLAKRVDSVNGCDRYATVLAWNKELFELFCRHLP